MEDFIKWYKKKVKSVHIISITEFENILEKI